MSVYVDTAEHNFGNMIMCHMLADTPEELRAMAILIGVKLMWFQSKASVPHFDICKSKRAEAIKAGAIIITERHVLVEKMRELRRTWPRDLKSGHWVLR